MGRNPGSAKVTDFRGFRQHLPPDAWSTQKHCQQTPLPANTTKARIVKSTRMAYRITQFDVVWKLDSIGHCDMLYLKPPVWSSANRANHFCVRTIFWKSIRQCHHATQHPTMPSVPVSPGHFSKVHPASSTLQRQSTTSLEKYSQYNWVFSKYCCCSRH